MPRQCLWCRSLTTAVSTDLRCSWISGPETAAEIVLAGVDKNDHEHHLTKLAYAALGKHGHRLLLDDRQADLALNRLSDDGDPIDVEHSVSVLSWVADHDGASARAFARRYVGDATISAPLPLELKAADLLGESVDPEDHAALLEFAGEYLDAGNPSHHGDLVGRLTSLTADDRTTLVDHLGRYSSNNWAPGPGIIGLLNMLTPDEFREFGARIPETFMAGGSRVICSHRCSRDTQTASPICWTTAGGPMLRWSGFSKARPGARMILLCLGWCCDR